MCNRGSWDGVSLSPVRHMTLTLQPECLKGLRKWNTSWGLRLKVRLLACAFTTTASLRCSPDASAAFPVRSAETINSLVFVFSLKHTLPDPPELLALNQVIRGENNKGFISAGYTGNTELRDSGTWKLDSFPSGALRSKQEWVGFVLVRL